MSMFVVAVGVVVAGAFLLGRWAAARAPYPPGGHAMKPKHEPLKKVVVILDGVTRDHTIVAYGKRIHGPKPGHGHGPKPPKEGHKHG